MRTHLIMYCYGVFVVGTLLSLIVSGIWLGPGEVEVLNKIAGFSLVKVEAMGGWAIPKSMINFFSALVTILTWNYPYLDNPWAFIFKLLFLYTATIGVIITLVQLAVAVIQGIAGTIRSLLPSS